MERTFKFRSPRNKRFYFDEEDKKISTGGTFINVNLTDSEATAFINRNQHLIIENVKDKLV